MSIWEIVLEWVGPWLEPVMDPVNEFFNFLLGPTVDRFDAVKAEVSAEPGAFEWVIAGLFLLFSILLVVAWIYVLISALAPLFGRFRGENPPRGRILQASIVGAVLVFLVDGVVGSITAIELTRRMATDLAVISSMYSKGTTVGVDINAFAFGLSNPLLVFTLEVALVIGVVTAFVRFWTNHSEQVVGIGLVAVTILTWLWATVTGTQVFPLDARAGLPLLVLVLYAIMTSIAWVLVRLAWGFLAWIPSANQGRRPRKLSVTFYGFLLLAAFPISTAPFLAVVRWSGVVLAYHGGIETAYNRLKGRQRVCRPDPETGVEVCDWVRSD